MLVKSSQYAATVGNGKFLRRDGHLATFVVRKVKQGSCHLSEIGTGKESVQHEAMLKILPNSLLGDEG